jgi:predicted nucleotidyltransferase
MAPEPAISEQDLSTALTEAVAALEQMRIKYAVIGGIATSFRSQPRYTKDLDFLLQIPQVTLAKLLEEFARRGFNFDEVKTIREWTQQHMTTLSYRGIRIDLLKPVLSVYQHTLDRAKMVTWLNQPVRVASVEGLILIKLLAFRSQDLIDIENLIAFHRNHLDLDWIRSEWQSIGSLDDPRMRKFDELVIATPPTATTS